MGHFCPPGSGSTDLNEPGSNTDPEQDPDRNPAIFPNFTPPPSSTDQLMTRSPISDSFGNFLVRIGLYGTILYGSPPSPQPPSLPHTSSVSDPDSSSPHPDPEFWAEYRSGSETLHTSDLFSIYLSFRLPTTRS